MKKSQIVFEDLRQKIINQELTDILPSEYDLCDLYEVGRGTIRESIKKLIECGYCIPQQGKGTFILPISENSNEIIKFKTFNNEVVDEKWKTEMVYVDEVLVNKKINKLTLFPIGEWAYIIHRVRVFEGKNAIYDTHYFLKSVVRDLTKEIIETSIYDYLENYLFLYPSITRENWTCEKVPKKFAKHLNLKSSDLCVINKKHVFLKDGTVFEYTEAFHRPDSFHMKMVNKRN